MLRVLSLNRAALPHNNRFYLNRSTKLSLKKTKFWYTNSNCCYGSYAESVSKSAADSLARRSIVDNNNVFRSPFEDINIPLKYVHEEVWECVGQWWDKTALINAATGKSYTYAELRKACGRFASSLRNNKLKPGDTLAVVLPNIPEYAVAVLGASEAGVRLTFLNPAYTSYEIGRQLEHSEACAVITIPEKCPVVNEAITSKNISLRIPPIVVPTGTEPVPEGTINFNELVADGITEFEKIGEQLNVDPEKDTFLLPYSSGTTGMPKGVELTHKSVVANFHQVRHPEYTFAEPAIGDHQDVVPLFLPFYHIYGLIVCLHYYLSMGAKIICIPQFSPTALIDVFEKHRLTMLYVAPPVVGLMVNHEGFKKDHFSCAKGLMSAAAPLGIELINKFQSKMGTNCRFTQGYGLTETSPIIARSTNADIQSVGWLTLNTRVRVVERGDSEEAKNLASNETGEIFIKGPQVMKGYLKNPEATAECMDGEWFKTGDIGHVDEKGQLFITGRLKELIKVKGLQVAPAELEDLIIGHEKVADVAVIGVPHERNGEAPKAFVVPKPGTKLSEEEITDFVAQRLSRHKHLEHVVFIDSIPKSAAGKILRRKLQKM